MRSLHWYRARLGAMSGGEIAYRVLQASRRRFRRLHCGRLNGPPGTADGVTAHPVSFFDVEMVFPSDGGVDWSRDYKNGVSAPMRFYGDIDYRDAAEVGDIKYTWELNRHQFIVPWAQEYARTGDERHANAVVALIANWIDANPRYLGVNWASSLEMALRILSWGISLDLCRGSKMVQNVVPQITASVSQQARYIRETLSLYSSANNHLVGELVGLLAAAVFFPEAENARVYAEFARARLWQEALKQTCEDGVNREQAIYYHHYTLEYLFTAIALCERVGWKTPRDVLERVRLMTAFVNAMVDDHGKPFEIGDTDDGEVTGLNRGTQVNVYESLLWTAARLFGSQGIRRHASAIAQAHGRPPGPDLKTVYWFGDGELLYYQPACGGPDWHFYNGGYLISRLPAYALMFKAGPFGYPSIAAHAHCDQLSVCVDVGEYELLIDSGTYCYHTDEKWRRYFRGTSAHNTVRVDGLDQAEWGGPFLWSTHADGWQEPTGPDEMWGEHLGYKRLPDPVSHRRCVRRHENEVVIIDELSAAGTHLYDLFWNLGPDVELEPQGAAQWRLLVKGVVRAEMMIESSNPIEFTTHRGDEQVLAGWYSRQYLKKQPIWQLRGSTRATAAKFETRLVILPEAKS